MQGCEKESFGPHGIKSGERCQEQQESMPTAEGRLGHFHMGLLLNKMGALVTEDTVKVDLLNTFFTSVSTAETAPWKCQTRESLRNGRFPFGQAGYSQRSSSQNQWTQIHGS